MSVNAPEAPSPTTPEAPAPENKPKLMRFEDLKNLSSEETEALETPPAPEKGPSKAVPFEDEDDDEDDDEDLEASEPDTGEAPDDDEDDEDEELASSDEEGEEVDDSEVFLEQKVDGKVMKFTEEEVRRIVASGAHNLQKMQAFEQQRVNITKQLDTARAETALKESKINPIFEKIEKKDIGGAVLDLATHAGLNKLEAKRHLFASVLPVVAQRLGLEPQWVQSRLKEMEPHNRVLDVAEEAAYYKEQVEEAKKASAPKEATPEHLFLQQMQQLQMEHGVSKGEVGAAIEFLEAQGGSEIMLTPEMVVQAAIMRKTVNKAFEAIRSVRPTLEQDNDFVDLVVKKARLNPEWGTDRLARWTEKKARKRAEAQKSQKLETLQRDVSRKVLKQPKSSFGNPNAGQKKPMRFIDLVNGED